MVTVKMENAVNKVSEIEPGRFFLAEGKLWVMLKNTGEDWQATSFENHGLDVISKVENDWADDFLVEEVDVEITVKRK